MINKITIFLALSFAIGLMSIPLIAHAQEEAEEEEKATPPKLEELFEVETITTETGETVLPYVEGLPGTEKPPAEVAPTIYANMIRLMLYLVGAIVTVGIVVAGVMFVTARGNEEQITKAKNIVLYIVIGAAIIAAAYAIVLGISRLEFFQ